MSATLLQGRQRKIDDWRQVMQRPTFLGELPKDAGHVLSMRQFRGLQVITTSSGKTYWWDGETLRQAGDVTPEPASKDR